MRKNLEDFFEKFRKNTVGYDKNFNTPYGAKKIHYFDYTASGRLYAPIESKISNEFGPYVGNTHSELNLTGSVMTIAYARSREIIKQHVNADKYDVLINSGFGMTSAINKLQRILGLRVPRHCKANIQEKDRPVVFLTHMEHHSNHTSWLETIADVVCIEPGDDGLVDLERMEAVLKRYKDRSIKIGSFTACSNVTGIVTPYHKMAELMHQYGGICFVDFAASAPYVKIDMHPENAMEKLDGVFFSPHKFLGGPGTAGVLVFDSRLYRNEVPDQPGGGTVDWTDPWGGRKYVDNIEAREDGGTPGFLQSIKTALCINLKNEMGIDNMADREEELAHILFDGLSEIDKVHILAGEIRARMGIVSFYLDNIHYNLLVRILNDRFGIQTRSGCSCAGTYGHYLLGIDRERSKSITNRIDHGDLTVKPGWIRLSIHPIMKNEEVHYAVEAVKETVKNIDVWKEDYIYEPVSNSYTNKSHNNYEQNIVKELFE